MKLITFISFNFNMSKNKNHFFYKIYGISNFLTKLGIQITGMTKIYNTQVSLGILYL
jgi:hypothetical protein